MNKINVTINFDGKQLQVRTNLLQDVGQLKEYLDTWYKIPWIKQKLFIGERELDDNQGIRNLKAGLKLHLDDHNVSLVLINFACDNRKLKVVAHPSQNVGHLKDLIEMWHSIPATKQRLFVGRNEVENETSILDCDLEGGVTLKLRDFNPMMHLTMILPNGESLGAWYHGLRTVQHVMDEVHEKLGFPGYLRYEGRVLLNKGLTLLQSGVRSGSLLICC